MSCWKKFAKTVSAEKLLFLASCELSRFCENLSKESLGIVRGDGKLWNETKVGIVELEISGLDEFEDGQMKRGKTGLGPQLILPKIMFVFASIQGKLVCLLKGTHKFQLIVSLSLLHWN